MQSLGVAVLPSVAADDLPLQDNRSRNPMQWPTADEECVDAAGYRGVFDQWLGMMRLRARVDYQ